MSILSVVSASCGFEIGHWSRENVAVVAGINLTSLFLSKVYSYATSSSPPFIIITLGCFAAYGFIKERSENYTFYRSIKRFIYSRFNNEYIKKVESTIQKVLDDEMGPKWLQMKKFTREEAIRYLTGSLHAGTCDGDVRAFLACIHRDQNWTRNDDELETKIVPEAYVAYQTMRRMMIEVRNDAIEKKEENLVALLEFCTKYDPYFIYRRYDVYRREAGARALDLVFSEFTPVVQESTEDKNNVLVGQITYLDEKAPAHTLAIQFNCSRFRIFDGVLSSFESQERLLQEIYSVSKRYFAFYKTLEVVLWKLPLI